MWRFFAREEGTEGMTADGMAAFGELDAYFRNLIRERRKGPRQDSVLGTLLEIEIDGEKIDDTAIASHLTMLIIGGAETFPFVAGTVQANTFVIAPASSLSGDAGIGLGVGYDVVIENWVGLSGPANIKPDTANKIHGTNPSFRFGRRRRSSSSSSGASSLAIPERGAGSFIDSPSM